MTEFAIGQRWVSHTETALGLGIIAGIEGRVVNISFPAAAEQRTYAMHNAPLVRIEYKPGDFIRAHDGKVMTVVSVSPHEGRLLYQVTDETGEQEQLDELELDCFVELATPKQRLTSGQLDDLKSYRLRCETLQHLNRLQQSPARGLLGSRTSLLPHQTYIAYEVARRFAPRVLLADEVGLGKTIEAGMILHYQLHTGLSERVLIIVPEPLVHQWLVEMLRRFNLRFSVFNAQRLQALDEEEGNPFDSEQLIICSLDLITDPRTFAGASRASWDMVVIDEAHHLEWDEQDSDPQAQNQYRCIEALASDSRGLLLLTATPEQVGAGSHFARLRLLDPARFHDFESFLEEEKGYRALSDTLAELLEGGDDLTDSARNQIKNYLGDELPQDKPLTVERREHLVNRLLDQHGTGRVFLRNTREAIKGFPARQLLATALPCPPLYQPLRGKQTLYPEIQLDGDDWLDQDPRVRHLIELLTELKREKVLVICAHSKTATELEKYLHLRVGIRSAAFYEDLSIIERDRAAAYFADPEAGAQVLVCSEIGSEGRNFQFAHHLVLFDLPLNPDLLEQRIGRLDRIGQTETIKIHVPYLEQTAQQVLFNWYHQGLNIFAESCAAAYAIFQEFAQPLHTLIDQPQQDSGPLVAQTRTHTLEVKQVMHDGRDRLVELNSCRPDFAKQVIQSIRDEEDPAALADYMELVLDSYGVDHEEHSTDAWILHPTDHMRGSYFPGLGDDSTTVTFDRDKALTREDMEFLSWEHPMVAESMAMTLQSELGNACVAMIKVKGIKPGTLLLESFFSSAYVAAKQLQIDRYLPLSPLRVLVNTSGKDLSRVITHQQLNKLCHSIKRHTAQQIVKQVRDEIEQMIGHSIRLSQDALPGVLAEARQRANTLLTAEIERLQQLQDKNASIRPEELAYLEKQRAACTEIIDNASYELQAVRLVIAN